MATVTGMTAAGIAQIQDGLTAALATKVDIDSFMINVKDHGVTGDGVTDDRAAIQTLINSANAAGGDILYFPRGIYRISDSLLLKTNVSIKGAGASGWPFRFPTPICAIKAMSSFTGECLISMLGADITGSSTNEGRVRISDIEFDGSALPAGSVTGIHAQGEVMDVKLHNVVVKSMTHNGIHTNVGTGTKSPHDWFFDTVISANNTGYGFSMSMTDGWLRNCISSTNHLDGWFLGPFGSMSMEGCQALFNTNNGLNIAGGAQIGNLSISSFLTDRNGHHGVQIGPSSGAGSPSIIFSALTLNRDGKNGNLGGGGYAGINISGCANPVIIEGLTVNTGVDDDATGVNSPQYGIALSGNAYVSVASGHIHGDTTGWYDDGTNVLVRRGINIGEATGPKATPTYNYNNGVSTSDGNLEAPGRALGIPRARDHGAIAWTMPPESCRSDKLLIAGTMYLAALYVPRATTAVKLYWGINTVGVGPVAGQNFVGIYDINGNKLTSVGVDARVTTNGIFPETISVAIKPGQYWIAFLMNATTMPKLYCGSDLNPGMANTNLGSTNARWATNGSALTAMPATINTASNILSQATLYGMVA